MTTLTRKCIKCGQRYECPEKKVTDPKYWKCLDCKPKPPKPKKRMPKRKAKNTKKMIPVEEE